MAERAGVCAGGSGPERGAGAAAGGWGRPAAAVARAAERRGATPFPARPAPRSPGSMNRLGSGTVGSATTAPSAAGQYRVCGNCRKVPRQVPVCVGGGCEAAGAEGAAAGGGVETLWGRERGRELGGQWREEKWAVGQQWGGGVGGGGTWGGAEGTAGR